MKRTLFGTSADPPTAGHQAILSWLSERYDWVAVWAADPLKSHQTPLSHRGSMLRLLIERLIPRGKYWISTQNLVAADTLSGGEAKSWGADKFMLVMVRFGESAASVVSS